MPRGDDHAVAGRLLVATPDLADENFAHAVVLVLEHADEGALGVILNRPRSVEVGALMPEWHDLAAAPPVLFGGGPVQTDEAVIALGRAAVPAQPVSEAQDCDVGVVDLELGREAQPEVTAIRLYVGYAGWGPGQLESELEAGGWFLVDPEPDDVLTADPDGLWRRVLERQGGVFRTVPRDPSQN